MIGKIIKGIAGSYYVHVVHSGTYECKAKGIFRYKNVKPLVGDNVEIEVLDEENKIGNIVDIVERENELIRPAVANIDQALVVFALKSPVPNLNLLDRFLVMMETQNVETVICFNKLDLVSDEDVNTLKNTYESAGYKVLFASANSGQGIDEIKHIISGKTTAFAGPSGVGKSSILNAIMPMANSQTGDISKKIQRGKHTTRHTEIFNVEENTYLMDTPGFSSMYVCECEKEELKQFFPEIYEYEGQCRFNGCVHINEPDCAVKDNVSGGRIGKTRYDNYVLLFNEIKDKKRY